MDNLIGINSRVQDPLGAQERYTHLRSYIPWSHASGYDNNTTASPVPAGAYDFDPSNDGGWAYDRYFRVIGSGINATLLGSAPHHRGVNRPAPPHALDLKPIYHPDFAPASQQANIDWSTVTDQQIRDYFTITSDSYQADPASYLDHAAAGTWFAARYGGNVSDLGIIRAYRHAEGDASAPIDLGYLGTFESQNETDKWWLDRPEDLNEPEALWQMKPQYFAAMTSADYDGHGNSSALRVPDGAGQLVNVGVHNASHEVPFVLGGLSNFRTGYLKESFEWWVGHRTPGQYGFIDGDVLPFDAFNFHHYANEGSPRSNAEYLSKTVSPPGWRTPSDAETKNGAGNAVSPEEEMLKEKLRWTMQETAKAAREAGVYFSDYAGKTFYLSEFGYDTELSSASAYDVPGSTRAERWLKQGQWLVRSFLEISAAQSTYHEITIPSDDEKGWTSLAGEAHTFTKAHAYEIRDEPMAVPQGANEYNQFQTGGLLHYEAQRQAYTKKNSWYMIEAMRDVLQGYRFVEELDVINMGSGYPSTPPRAYLYETTQPGVSGHAKYRIAYWSPTSTGWTGNLDVQFVSPSLKPMATGIPQFWGNGKPAAYELVPGSEAPQYTRYTTSFARAGRFYSDRKLRLRDMPTSETPRFIDLDDELEQELPITISNIQSDGGCCDGRAITWTSVRGTTGDPRQDRRIPYPAYNVYVVPKSLVNNDPAQFVPGMPGSIEVASGIRKKRTYATGLESGVDYFAFVYPVNRATGRFIGPRTGGPTGTISAGCVGNCFIASSKMTVSASSSANLSEGNAILSAGATMSCSDVELPTPYGDCAADSPGTNLRPDWNWDYTSSNGQWVEVRFNEEYAIDAITLEDDYGTGDLIIEGKQCDCEDSWRQIIIYRTNSRCPRRFVTFPNIGNWRTIRFRKVTPGANVGSIAFCGKPTDYECGLTTSPTEPVESKNAASEPDDTPMSMSVAKNTEDFVQLEWDVVDVHPGHPEDGVVLDYLVQLYEVDNPKEYQLSRQNGQAAQSSKEEQSKAQANEVTPVGKPNYVRVEPGKLKGTYKFANLKQGTYYEARVEPTTESRAKVREAGGSPAEARRDINECFPPGNDTGGSVAFYPFGAGGGPSSAPLRMNPRDNSPTSTYSYEDWSIGPNPNTGSMTVDHPGDALELSVIDAVGRQVYFQTLSPGQTQSAVTVQQHVNGMHLVLLRFEDQMLRKWIYITE